MHTYDFVKKNLSLVNVQSIISTAGYTVGNYVYVSRVDNDGYVVTTPNDDDVMNINKLENAAKQLKINNVEISSPIDASLSLAGDGTAYQVNVTMSVDTVQKLLQNNYYLYGFKAVQSTIGEGSPLVWFKTETFSTTTAIGWEEQYQAYTSNSNIITNGQVTASFSTSISLGQTLNVAQGGVGQVVDGGPGTAVSLNNTTSVSFTCGISEMQNGTANPLCAFPLFGNNLDVIAPIEKVLLMFSTNPINTGTVIEQSYGPGILIDLTSDNLRNVNYDINGGWSWGKYPWGQEVAANSKLVPLLIETPSASFRRRTLVSG